MCDGVSKLIMDSFELFHIECEENMIAAVDEFIEQKKRVEAVYEVKKKSGREVMTYLPHCESKDRRSR